MADFAEVDKARKILGLSEEATLKEIKTAYRALSQRYHPDKQGGTSDKDRVMKGINWSYQILMEYCSSYRFSFRETDVSRVYPYEHYMRNWRDNWFDSI